MIELGDKDFMDQIEFGTDGIRQTAGMWPIDVIGAQKVGLGIGRFLIETRKKPRVVIGRDTRISGDMLSCALNSGLLSFGVDVLDIGVITTPGIAYLTRNKNADLGIVISASHNNWTENGIKLIGQDGFKLDENIERIIEKYINEAHRSHLEDFGRIFQQETWVEDYIQYLIKPFSSTDFQKMSVVLDCANGAASYIAPRCFELLGVKTIVLNNYPSGTNINLDSGSEIVRAGKGQLGPTVIREDCNLGIAYDGDADRAIFIDETGKMVDGDNVLFIIGEYLNSIGNLNGNTIVTTEMANMGLEHALAPLGINIIYTQVGDKYVVSKMREEGYRLGGEQSGHVIILDADHTTGDGIYTSLYLANLLIQSKNLSLNLLSSRVVKLPQVIASASVSQKPNLESINDFVLERKKIIKLLGRGAIINTRYSGTEPVFRVMIQGTESNSLDEIVHYAKDLCRLVQSFNGDYNARIEAKDCTTGDLIE